MVSTVFIVGRFRYMPKIRHTLYINVMNPKVFRFGCLAMLCISPSFAQNPTSTAPAPIGEAVMKTNIGAFKITSPGDVKAFGKVQITFKGTLLIVGYDSSVPIVASAGLNKEYENKQRERIEFFGQGTVTLDGKFRAIQFFGRNLDMKWVGNGICRVYGEFDKNGDTGTFEVKGDQKRFWGSGGTTFTVPPRNNNVVAPKVKIKGSGG